MITVHYHDGTSETYGEGDSHCRRIRDGVLEIEDQEVVEVTKENYATHIRHVRWGRHVFIPLVSIKRIEDHW